MCNYHKWFYFLNVRDVGRDHIIVCWENSTCWSFIQMILLHLKLVLHIKRRLMLCLCYRCGVFSLCSLLEQYYVSCVVSLILFKTLRLLIAFCCLVWILLVDWHFKLYSVAINLYIEFICLVFAETIFRTSDEGCKWLWVLNRICCRFSMEPKF